MRGSLSVRINDGYTDRQVTSHVKDLRFKKTAPGGHHDASCTLIMPSTAFRDLGPADRMFVYDKRTARTIWEGYTENPGVANGKAGQAWDLTAMGGMSLASDQSRALVYVDRTLDAWKFNWSSLPSMTGDVSTIPGAGTEDTAADALVLTFPRGIAVANAYRVTMTYGAITQATGLLGGFGYTVVSGISDSNYQTIALVPGHGTPRATNASTTSTDIAAASAGSDFTVGGSELRLQFKRVAGGATNIANDNTWAAVNNIWVRGLLLDAYGNQISGAGKYGNGYVLASDVATDLLGRMLTMCDPLASSVAPSTYHIDQLAYTDGVRPADLLNDLALYEPDFLWEILESSNAGHRFNFRAWPTTPRYTISTSDGYNAPGGESDLCNRIAVFWTDAKGAQQVTVVTQAVPALGGDPAAVGFTGRIRDAEPVTLPDGHGSAANAQQVGAQVLATKAAPSKSATASVARPITDQLTGKTVMPWEIEPGYVVRVRETGDDLRLTEVEYSDNDCTASLTLGDPIPSVEQVVAQVARKVGV